jgi:hypothetical protein
MSLLTWMSEAEALLDLCLSATQHPYVLGPVVGERCTAMQGCRGSRGDITNNLYVQVDQMTICLDPLHEHVATACCRHTRLLVLSHSMRGGRQATCAT